MSDRDPSAGGIGSVHAEDPTIAWLLTGDPAIRWQVLRDLVGAPAGRWQEERAKVATEGWGARLLAHQDSDGRWTPRFYGTKWISTTYSLVLLRRMGLAPHEPRALQSCALFIDEGLRPDGGIDPSASTHRSETCVTGMVLAHLSWFGADDPRRDQLVAYLLGEQLPDGGWNCERSTPQPTSSRASERTLRPRVRAATGPSWPSRRGESSYSSTASTGRIAPEPSSTPGCSGCRSPHDGGTTSCAASTTSDPPMSPTLASATPSGCSWPSAGVAGAGPSNSATPAEPGSTWNTSANPAAGTPFAPDASSSGGGLCRRSAKAAHGAPGCDATTTGLTPPPVLIRRPRSPVARRLRRSTRSPGPGSSCRASGRGLWSCGAHRC